jgi:hypothetical protein
LLHRPDERVSVVLTTAAKISRTIDSTRLSIFIAFASGRLGECVPRSWTKPAPAEPHARPAATG